MIGRGCFGNPWIFQQAAALLAGEPGAGAAEPGGAVRHRRAGRSSWPPGTAASGVAVLTARRHYAWYLKGVPHASYYKEQIVRIGDAGRRLPGDERDQEGSA